jgi:putative FmdB family regulatory protein
MPIYEYRCDDCGHELETIQKISDDPLKECPSCGKSKLKKLVSAAGFQLKGSGWYETDFKNKPKADNNKSADKNKNKAPSGSAGSGSDKPKKAGDCGGNNSAH